MIHVQSYAETLLYETVSILAHSSDRWQSFPEQESPVPTIDDGTIDRNGKVKSQFQFDRVGATMGTTDVDSLIMPYSHFKTLSSAIDAFELELHEEAFFPELKPIVPSETLRIALEDSLPTVAASSEKARSEGLIYPVLMEARRILNKQVSLFSGEEFMVDEAAGLTGIVDFLMSRSPQISTIQAPAIVVVEAKKADLRSGFGQCVAEMVAADRFNQRRDKTTDRVYGIVTNGTQWRFLQLQNVTLRMDLFDYPLIPIDRLLAQLCWILREG